MPIQADSADPAAVKRSVEEAVMALGGLDILVNNAGIARMGPFAELSLEDLDALLHVQRPRPHAGGAGGDPAPEGRQAHHHHRLERRRARRAVRWHHGLRHEQVGAAVVHARGLARASWGPEDITRQSGAARPGETEMNRRTAVRRTGPRLDRRRALRPAGGHRGGRWRSRRAQRRATSPAPASTSTAASAPEVRGRLGLSPRPSPCRRPVAAAGAGST